MSHVKDICFVLVCSVITGALAQAQIIPYYPGGPLAMPQPAQMSDTYYSYQKTLLKHLDELKQKYLSDEFTKDIPKAVLEAAGKSENLILDEINEYQGALDGATQNVQTLEKKVKEFESQEKKLADIMVNGGVIIGHMSSLQSMADTCKQYDISKDKDADPEALIKKNYNDSIDTMNKASNRLWDASNKMWNSTHHGPASQVLANPDDPRQSHVAAAQRGAYEAIKDLTHLRDTAVSDYESFINKSKAQRVELEKENKSLQERCADVQKRMRAAADQLTGHHPQPAPAPVTPVTAPATVPVSVKKIVKKHRPKPKPKAPALAPAPDTGDVDTFIYPDQPNLPLDDSEKLLLPPPANNFLLPPPSSEGDH